MFSFLFFASTSVLPPLFVIFAYLGTYSILTNVGQREIHNQITSLSRYKYYSINEYPIGRTSAKPWYGLHKLGCLQNIGTAIKYDVTDGVFQGFVTLCSLLG